MTRPFLTPPQSREGGSFRKGFLIAASVAVIAVVLGANYLSGRDQGPALLSGLEPMPDPTRADFRVEQLDDGRMKFWPRSAPLIEGVKYRFNTGHCGLEWLTDFDGSFWTPHRPEGEAEPRFFYSEDVGTLTVLSHDRALYRSSNNKTVLLTRHEGPLVVEGACA